MIPFRKIAEQEHDRNLEDLWEDKFAEGQNRKRRNKQVERSLDYVKKNRAYF